MTTSDAGGEGPVSRDSASSYQWGPGCFGWHLVRSADLSVIQEEMPAGAEEVRHRHRHARQFFFVLRGVLVMECDGVRHVLESHSGIEVPPMTPHQARNESAAAVEFLVISEPPSHGDREAVE
jgi:mannose-6-phosphate isomerase-like protein (cupin superfamily)